MNTAWQLRQHHLRGFNGFLEDTTALRNPQLYKTFGFIEGIVFSTLVASGSTLAGSAFAIAAITGAVSIGLSVGLSYLASSLFAPKAPRPEDVQQSVKNPIAPRMRHYGRVKVSGPWIFAEAQGGSLYKVLALGQGPIDAIEQYWIDDEQVTVDVNSDGLVTSGGAANVGRIMTRLGAASETSYAFLSAVFPVWTSDHRGDGVASLFAFQGAVANEDFLKTYPNGLQTNYRVVLRGAKVKNPITGAIAWNDNAAAIIRDYIVHKDGMRLPESVVSTPLAQVGWVAAYSRAAQSITTKSGREPRYRLWGSYSLEERPADVLGRMMASCDGRLVPTPDGGLTLDIGEWQEPTVTLDENIIVGFSEVGRGRDVLSTANTIRAKYLDPNQDYQGADADPWVDAADEVFRDFTTDRVPSSGAHKPKKAEVRAWGNRLENSIEGAVAGRVDATTWAGLSLIAGTRDGQPGIVYGPDAGSHADAVSGDIVPNEGIYAWFSTPGTWRRIGNLQRELVHAINTGEGTANAVRATPDGQFDTTAYRALITVNFVASNTGPVTLSLNGEAPRSLVTNAGAAVTPGYVQPGMSALVQIDGYGNYRLFSYGDAAAIQSVIEALLVDAQAARDAALAAVPDFNPVSLAAMKADFNRSTHISAYLLDPDRAGQFVFRTGNFTAQAAADPAEGVIVKADDAPISTGALLRLYQGAVSVKWFGAKGDGVTDDRAACQAAIDYVAAQGGGDVMFPDGDYKIVGVAIGTDPLGTGLVIPHHSSLEMLSRIRLIPSGRARVFAGSDNQILIRMSRAGSEVKGLIIDGRCTVGGSLGDGYGNVWSVGMVAQDRSDTATLTSSSFCKVHHNVITGCIEGVVQEPGPTVGGSQAGCFYQYVGENDFNFCKRMVWLKPALNDGTNRPTRGMIFKNRCTRGQGGVDIEYGSEISVIGNNFEMMLGATYGTDLRGFGYGVYVGELAAYNWADMNFMEQCDRHYAIHASVLPNALMISGDPLAGVSENTGFSPVVAQHLHRVTRRTAAYERLGFEAHHAAFAGLYFDLDGNNTRNAGIRTNNVTRQMWAPSGGTTIYGSEGNIDVSANGRTISSSSANGLSLTATGGGPVSLSGQGGTSIGAYSTALRPVSGVSNLGIDATNTTGRWNNLFLQNAPNVASDGRLKDKLEWSETELRVASACGDLITPYRMKEAALAPGEEALIRFGVIAQEVIAAFEAEGLNALDYQLIRYSTWDNEYEAVTDVYEFPVKDEEGNWVEAPGNDVEVEPGELRLVRAAGDMYSVAYEELLSFVAKGQEIRLQTVEARLAALEAL